MNFVPMMGMYCIFVCVCVFGMCACVSVCLRRSQVSLGIQGFLSIMTEMGSFSSSLLSGLTTSWRCCCLCLPCPHESTGTAGTHVAVPSCAWLLGFNLHFSCLYATLSKCPAPRSFSFILKTVCKRTLVQHVLSGFVFSMV